MIRQPIPLPAPPPPVRLTNPLPVTLVRPAAPPETHVQFGLGSTLGGTLAEGLMKGAGPASNLFWQFINMKESANGLAHFLFMQDTAINAAPKAAVSRSKADLTENMFLEFTESGLFYYFPVVLGQWLFQNAFHKLGSLSGGFKKEALMHKLGNEGVSQAEKVAAEAFKKAPASALPVKAAIVLASMGVVGAGEFGLSFLKNLLTVRLFHQGDFTRIAHLNQSNQNPEELAASMDKVKKDAHKWLAFSGAFAGASTALGGALAAFGPKFPALQRFSEGFLTLGDKLFNKLTQMKWVRPDNENLHRTLQGVFNYDFKMSVVKEGKGINYALSNPFFRTTILAGVVGYILAARDKLERIEVATRLSLVATYLMFGNQLLETQFFKFLKNRGHLSPELIKNGFETFKLNELTGIAREAAEKKLAETGKHVTPELVEQTASGIYQKLFKQKAVLSLFPIVFGVGIVGLGVGLMNRAFTQYRYSHGIGTTDPNENLQKEPVKAFPVKPQYISLDRFPEAAFKGLPAQGPNIAMPKPFQQFA